MEPRLAAPEPAVAGRPEIHVHSHPRLRQQRLDLLPAQRRIPLARVRPPRHLLVEVPAPPKQNWETEVDCCFRLVQKGIEVGRQIAKREISQTYVVQAPVRGR